jgi:hypothetical protein
MQTAQMEPADAAQPCPVCLEEMGAPQFVAASAPLPRGVYRRRCGHALHAVCAMRAVEAGRPACAVCRALPSPPDDADDDTDVAAFSAALERAGARLWDTRYVEGPRGALVAAQKLRVAWLAARPALTAELIALALHAADVGSCDPAWHDALVPAWVLCVELSRQEWLRRGAPALASITSSGRWRLYRQLRRRFVFVECASAWEAASSVTLAHAGDGWVPRCPIAGAWWLVPNGLQFKAVVDGAWTLHPVFPTERSPDGAFVNNVARAAR